MTKEEEIAKKIKEMIGFNGPEDDWHERALIMVREIQAEDASIEITQEQLEVILQATKEISYVPEFSTALDWSEDNLPDPTMDYFVEKANWFLDGLNKSLNGGTQPPLQSMPMASLEHDTGHIASSGGPLSEYWHAARIMEAQMAIQEQSLRLMSNGAEKHLHQIIQSAFETGFLFRDAHWLKQDGKNAAENLVRVERLAAQSNNGGPTRKKARRKAACEQACRDVMKDEGIEFLDLNEKEKHKRIRLRALKNQPDLFRQGNGFVSKETFDDMIVDIKAETPFSKMLLGT